MNLGEGAVHLAALQVGVPELWLAKERRRALDQLAVGSCGVQLSPRTACGASLHLRFIPPSPAQ